MSWPSETVSDWAEFREKADGMLPKGAPTQPLYAFRGQSSVAWTLLPSLARLLPGWPVDEALKIEANALAEFQSQAITHLPANILSQTVDTFGWWALMQHYRAPTRLLDWSLSPYVAAYFAVAQGWGTGDRMGWSGTSRGEI